MYLSERVQFFKYPALMYNERFLKEYNMKRVLYPLLISALLLTGCGDSFYSARDYLTGPVDGIGLKSSTSLVSGGTEQLYPVVSPPDTSNKSVIWTSSDSSVVSVDSNGVITGVAAPAHGATETAVITAITAEGGYSAMCTVTVSEKPVAITGVTISKSAMTIPAGNQEQLTATVAPAVATNQNLTWTSSSSSKVTVDASGLVTAIAAGTAIVTVNTVDGGYKASCTVTSTTDPVYTVTYNSNTATGGDVPSDTNVYLSGSTVTVMDSNTLYKTSNTFAGWNTSSNGSGTTYAVGSTFTIGSSDAELYALWSADPTYTITYDGNSNTGGDVPIDTNHYLPGANVTVLGNTGILTRTNFAFGGWYIDSSHTYNAGNSFIMPANNIRLLAKWVPAYTVTYFGNGSTGGTVPVDNTAYAEGSNVIVRSNSGNLTRTGYMFQGWYSLYGTYYQPGQSFIMGSSNVVLFANWSTVFTTYGIITLTGNCIVTVKAWGAGGKSQSNGYDYCSGGGGGYSYSVFSATAGDVLHVVVGTGGGNPENTSMPALGGNFGGGGSLVAIFRAGNFTLKSCAGGGGSGYASGAGGGASGESISNWFGVSANGGSNGIGGYGTVSTGSDMSLTSATLIGFNGNGGSGSSGGGYGGGGFTVLNIGVLGDYWVSHSAGGGGYCEGNGSTTVTGSGATPGNNTDPNLPTGYAVGGINGANGGNGIVIVSIVYN
ncbi:MAG: hypothetical protein CVV49_11655 [Spirochaetae bacterium HGW-Spirochaetae-5]|nr:MAG: hypothetical protein CVV49_11655 [Spirochaetae bacterium HGW-Spirochaetae-5]